MESEKGKSAVPIVNKFEIEGSWVPRTPLKWPLYENGEVEAFLSRFPDQNHNQKENQAQTLLSYSMTSAAESSNMLINNGISWENVEMQTRGYLPNWNNKGRRTNTNYTYTPAPGATAAGQGANLSSWPSRNNNGAGAGFGLGLGHHHLDQLHDAPMSFGDLLAMNGSAAYLPPNWDCNHAAGISHGLNGSSVFYNHSNLQQHHNLHQQINLDQKYTGLESCDSPRPYKGICEVNSPHTTRHTNGKTSTFAPTTPDSRWRIESNVAFKNSPFGPYQSPFNRDNVLPEQDAAAAMVNLQNANEEVVVPNTTDSSPGIASMTVENHNPDQGDDQVIDLNKTPQKKPRRRRYQPKVLSEKKPKQTPKPKTPKPNTDSKETVQSKRKYVRKNKVNTPSTPPPEGVTKAGEPTPAANEAEATKEAVSAAKSCKKSLNFDLNGVAVESNSLHMPNGESYAETKPSKCGTAGVQCWGTKHLRQGEELVVETSCGVTSYDLTQNSYHEIQNYLSLPTKDHPYTSQSRNYVHPGHNPNSSPCGSSNEPEETRSTKRSNLCMENVNAVSVGASHCSAPSHPMSGSATVGELQKNFLPDNCKKKRTEKVFRADVSSMSYAIAPYEHVNQLASAPIYPRVDPTVSKYYCNPAPFGRHIVTDDHDVVTDDHAKVLERSVENRVQLLNTWGDVARLNKKKRSKGTTLVRNVDPLKGILSPLRVKPGPKGPHKKKNINDLFQHLTSESVQTCAETLAVDSKAYPKSKRKTRKRKSLKQWDLVLYDQSSRKTTGSLPWMNTNLSSVEEITERMRLLDLNREGCNTSRQEQNAVVCYNEKNKEQNALVVYERNGTMVPFDGPFNPVRKRRQRAKVDLDDETNRVWKLLLENIDNKGIDGSDEDKAKWWENERSVFRGRVDSFIARMRLVQGDRRFTPWKGSVLDSVIGVFLTQNVSDHLSSSAFMAMAAHFPLKSECSESTISEESTTAFVEQPDVIEPVESTKWDKKAMDQQILSSKPRNVHEIDHIEAKEVVNSIEPRALGLVSPKDCSSESSHRAYNGTSQITETETASLLGDDRAKDDVTSSQHSVISSQNSTNSPHLQAAADIMSFFPENSSRTEHLTTSTLCSYYDSTPFLDLLKMAESPFFHESYSETQIDPLEYKNHVADRSLEAERVCPGDTLLNLNFQFPDTEGIELLVEESGSPDTSRKDENSSPTDQSNLTTESAIHHSSMEKSSDTIPRLFAENSCSFYVLEGENMVMQTHRKSEEPKSATVSVNGQTSSTSKGINLSQLTAGVTESTTGMKRTRNDQKEVEISDLNANTSTSKKGKAGKGKTDEFDWDSLRREAKANGRIREKTANTKDSLDWEAVRHAHVSEIAETIKERGMNNMLAERIKELLDRLVRDHGSMDMEWLRDIPPDKAKEYLLSFRGLGLKSVECVRLLTLHHLAFPVDTNVARIAVRLGWVPLQPLPESLQLHLLELYPILETIQKYLWPRLCKLDQRTLYELHYHLITFGKVFCTKRQPNCNACPLRGECRHFASAFASARFALPGPEEKGIVPSSRTNTASPRPQATSNFLPLPPAWSTQYSQSNSRCDNGAPLLEISSSPLALPSPETRHQLEKQSEIRNCEPIVEVPASPEPEPHIEQTLCDIEDTFDEDPNEIPVIKLNMEEFSQTLQNYMQTKSNALVPLTPEAASIPTPKLKNVNRLRTEHHVYELPDTHPLLKSLDKREPDDPCSYLLAIWTPGETADSIRPPERRCNSEDPNIMCNEETCSYCNCQREANSQIVRGTLLIPCRTAMRGSFPLNGTYFQVNEVFADHDSSLNPIAVPRTWLWNLPRRTVYFGTSIPTIFRGLSTEEIQHCFRRGFVCVRGFDQKRRAPRPLMARLHFPASRMSRGTKGKTYDE